MAALDERPETFTRAGKRHLKIVGHRSPDVGKGRTHTEIDRYNACAIDQKRNIFPGVVGVRVSGITSVIGGNHQKVVLPHSREKRGQPTVKSGKSRGITRHILPVTV